MRQYETSILPRYEINSVKWNDKTTIISIIPQLFQINKDFFISRKMGTFEGKPIKILHFTKLKDNRREKRERPTDKQVQKFISRCTISSKQIEMDESVQMVRAQTLKTLLEQVHRAVGNEKP